ncbi:MAG: DUF222 domain-containing protein [Actinomycetota bacterium]
MSIRPVLDAFGHVMTDLGALDSDQLSPSELRDGLAELKILESQLSAQLARLTHDADRRGAFIGTGARDTAEWLGKETGTSTRKNRTAAELGEAMARSDELAEAVAAGAISTEKAAAAVGAAGVEAVDRELIDRITDAPLNDVRARTEQWRAAKRPDGEADRAERRRAKRYLRMTDVDEGMTRIDGLLDPASAATVRTTLDAVISESAFDETQRSREQRCADALTQLATAASKGEITGGRSNARVLATVPYETITDGGVAPGHSHAGTMIDATSIRQMCCDAGIHRVITGPGSSILDFGHENRLVSDNLFLALVARDRHCRWPGCTLRGTWCDAHHVIEWQTGGRTAEDTCALLCHHHHSVLHLPGWTVRGNGHRFEIHHPDGTVEVSTPPPAMGSHTVSGARSGSPPDRSVPRADEFGRETTTDDVLESLERLTQQLSLV